MRCVKLYGICSLILRLLLNKIILIENYLQSSHFLPKYPRLHLHVSGKIQEPCLHFGLHIAIDNK